jgi:hypothetical protein
MALEMDLDVKGKRRKEKGEKENGIVKGIVCPVCRSLDVC